MYANLNFAYYTYILLNMYIVVIPPLCLVLLCSTVNNTTMREKGEKASLPTIFSFVLANEHIYNSNIAHFCQRKYIFLNKASGAPKE